MNYTELSQLKPTEFLNWKQFETSFDAMNNISEDRDNKQYDHGLEIGNEFDYVTISRTSVWSAGMNAGGKSVTSYEGIGYHANTTMLMKGFIDSGCDIYVYRDSLGKRVKIK